MSGNSFGKIFSVTSFGESHGPAIGAIVDGCPPGMPLTVADFKLDLDRRKPGKSRYETQRREPDEVELLSGVFEGVTTGTPIGLVVKNVDQRSKDYSKIADSFRPGHADYTYLHKYGIRDYRGGGRSSARETTMRVAAGVIAKKYLLQQHGIEVKGYLSAIGPIEAHENSIDWQEVESNAFFWPNSTQIKEIETYMQALIKAGDSIGACVSVVASRVPVGLGEPVFDRLDADLAKAVMCINAVKGVEIGDGFASAAQRGTEHRDELSPEGFLSNHAGGVLGGISSGQDIKVRAALKPTSSIRTPGQSVRPDGSIEQVSTTGRHDPCVGIRAVPIVEAMVAITLMDHLLRHRGQCGGVKHNVVDIETQ